MYYLYLSFTSLYTDLSFPMKREHLTRPCTFFSPQEGETRMSRNLTQLPKDVTTVMEETAQSQDTRNYKAEGKKTHVYYVGDNCRVKEVENKVLTLNI